MKKSKQLKYEIIIGLKDKDTYLQMLPTSKFVEIVTSVCKRHKVGYSIHTMDGGYIHENGTYIEETSLSISMVYITKKQALEIAKHLKALFNQETVIVLEQETDSYLI